MSGYDYSTLVVDRWESSDTIAVDTDWLSTDTGPLSGNTGNRTVKHILQIMVPTSTVVNIQFKQNSITKVLDLNKGVALAANAGYQFTLLLEPSDTYNIQHKTTTQNVSIKIFEANNLDL